MREIHFVGEAPSVNGPSPGNPEPSGRDDPDEFYGAVIVSGGSWVPAMPRFNSSIPLVSNGSRWIVDPHFTRIPGTDRLTHDGSDGFVPIVLPPAASFPRLEEIGFSNLPITSISDIGNIDEYRGQITLIEFNNCPLALEDLSWFAGLPRVKTIRIDNCELQSLRGIEQINHPVNIYVQRNGIELSKEIGTIEAHARRLGRDGRSERMDIYENMIAGRSVQKKKSMTTATTIGYIRGWMAQRGVFGDS